MIIDVHTHIPRFRGAVPESERRINRVWRPDRAVDAVVSWEDYLEAMRPVDKSIVFGVRFKDGIEPIERQGQGGTGTKSDGDVNTPAAELARAYPDKIIGFMSVHADDAGVVEEMERCYHDLGLRGVKLGPNYQNYDPLGKNAFLIYETAQRLGIPILFHQGTSPMRTAPIKYAHPLVMDEIAIAFPELRIVMAHMGHPWQVDTFVVIRKHSNVYADVSAAFYRPWSQYDALRLATEWNVLDKLLLGSDYPVATPQETIDGLLGVNKVVEGTGLPRVPEEKLHEIVHRDSLKLLGIQG